MRTYQTQQSLAWPADGTLTVTSVRPNSTDETAAVTLFAVYPGTLAEARPSNGVFLYQSTAITFDLDAVPFSLKPRDTLQWDRDALTDTYTVKSATPAPFLKFWKLDTFQLVAQADLADTIAVYRPTVTRTADGLRSQTLAVVTGFDAVPGRIQPDSWQAEGFTDDRLTRRRSFTAYLSLPILLEAGDVLRSGGVDYEVTRQSDIDQLATFTAVSCTRIV